MKKDIQINIPNEKEWKRWIIYVLLVLAYTFILVSATDYIQDVKVWKLTMYAVDLIKILPAVWYIRKLGLRKQDFFGGKNMGFQILTGIGSGLLLATIVSFPELISVQDLSYAVRANQNVFLTTLKVLFDFMLIAALFEEITFRIAMQEGLCRLLGKAKVVAPLICSVIFGLWHYPVLGSWSQVLLTGTCGLVWGYLRMYFGWNIIGLVLSHGVYDILVIYLPLLASKF